MSDIDIVYTVIFLLEVFSFMVSNILLLRMGYLAVSIAGMTAGFLIDSWASIGGNFVVLMINVTWVSILLFESRAFLLPKNLRRIYKTKFETMTTREFFYFYQLGKHEIFAKKEIIIKQNKTIDRIMMITHGKVEVRKGSELITTLEKDAFIGEMQFLTESTAITNIIAIGDDVQCVSWDRSILAKLQSRKNILHAKLISALISDVVAKVKLLNKTIGTYQN